MCNFNTLDEETKAFLALFMQKASANIGGLNFLLSLIEAIRKKHSPLTGKKMQIASNNSIIKWNKVIFQDKALLLEEILNAHRESQNKDFNILANTKQKNKKKIINLAKTLKPVTFIVKPQNPNDGDGFSFGVFDTLDIDKEIIKLNPVFLAMFFCSTEFTKNAIKYDMV